MRMTISVCTYQNTEFEVIIKDTDTGKEVMLSGMQEIDAEDFDLINKLAPACVWTTYKREET